MSFVPDNPLVVQGDHTLLLETMSPRYTEARDALLAFAEIVKSPGVRPHLAHHAAQPLERGLGRAHARRRGGRSGAVREVPDPRAHPGLGAREDGRYGTLRLLQDGPWLVLEADDPLRMAEIRSLKVAADLLGEPLDATRNRIGPARRGELKQVLTSVGHPVQDLAGYEDGDPLAMALRPTTPGGEPWSLREYQVEATDAFAGGPSAGSGVIVLPCGAGKTMVGIAAMVRLGMRTLVVCTGHTALQQWRRQILEHTTLGEEQVGEYTADANNCGP
jgi:DNA excision repair protein ERCC-3